MSKRVLLLLVPVLLVSFWLGTRELNTNSIWYDEYRSIYDAGGADYGPLTPVGIWQRVAERNPWHTPGFFILFSGWGRLVGWEHGAGRIFALLAGMLAVAWTYRFGKDHLSARVGVVGAAVLAVSPLFVYYLHEIRQYSLIAALTALTYWAYLHVMTGKRPTRWHWVAFTVGALGLAYMHYLATMPLVVIALVHLFAAALAFVQRRRTAQSQRPDNFWRRWWGVISVGVVVALLFAPWLSTLSEGLDRVDGSDDLERRALTAGEVLERVGYLFGAGVPLLALIVPALSLLRRGRVTLLLWWFVLAHLGIMLAINAVLPVIPETRIRYLMPLWIPLSLLAALGFEQVRRRRYGRIIAPALVTVWLSVSVVRSADIDFVDGLGGTVDRFPMHHVALLLRDVAQAEDMLVAYLPDGMNINNYEPGRVLFTYYLDALDINYLIGRTRDEPEEREDELAYQRVRLRDRDRVWLAYMPAYRPAALTELVDFLDAEYHHCDTTRDYRRLRMEQYAPAPVCCLTAERLENRVAQYDGGVGLVALDTQTAPETLTATLLWSRADDIPPHTYSATINVFDADGARVAGVDYGLEPLAYTCQRAEVDIRALPPGEYTVRVGVYPWQSGERRGGTQTISGEQGDLLAVGYFAR